MLRFRLAISALVLIVVMLAGLRNYIRLGYHLSPISANVQSHSMIQEVRKSPSIRYVGGVFGHLDAVTDRLIKGRCHSQSPVLDGGIVDRQCSGDISRFSCCYCFDEYPDFVWKSEVRLLPPADSVTHPNDRYWFCVEPMEMNQSDSRYWSYHLSSAAALVTGKWGHGNVFKREVAKHCNLARGTGVFAPDKVFCYSETPDYVLQDPRFIKHLRFQTDPNDVSAKGGGYWFHKAVTVRHHSYSLNDGDYIVWTDVDRADFFRPGTLHTLLYVMEQRGADLMIETMGGLPEGSWTKEDVLLAFNASNSIRSSNQLNANAWIVRNSQSMRKFLDALVDCVSDWHMVSDDPSIIPNRAEFVDHRHDQSILALLIKQFLIKQAAVGPPARAYQLPVSTYFTYTFDKSSKQEPSCPFPKFYAAQTTGNRTRHRTRE